MCKQLEDRMTMTQNYKLLHPIKNFQNNGQKNRNGKMTAVLFTMFSTSDPHPVSRCPPSPGPATRPPPGGMMSTLTRCQGVHPHPVPQPDCHQVGNSSM